jgi:hypothetical protein
MEKTLIEARAFRDLAKAAEWLAIPVDALTLKDEPCLILDPGLGNVLEANRVNDAGLHIVQIARVPVRFDHGAVFVKRGLLPSQCLDRRNSSYMFIRTWDDWREASC